MLVVGTPIPLRSALQTILCFMVMSKQEAVCWNICRQWHLFLQGRDVLGTPVASYFTLEELYFYLLAKGKFHGGLSSLLS